MGVPAGNGVGGGLPHRMLRPYRRAGLVLGQRARRGSRASPGYRLECRAPDRCRGPSVGRDGRRVHRRASAGRYGGTPGEVHRAGGHGDRECGEPVGAGRLAPADRRRVRRGPPPDRAGPARRYPAAAGLARTGGAHRGACCCRSATTALAGPIPRAVPAWPVSPTASRPWAARSASTALPGPGRISQRIFHWSMSWLRVPVTQTAILLQSVHPARRRAAHGWDRVARVGHRCRWGSSPWRSTPCWSARCLLFGVVTIVRWVIGPSAVARAMPHIHLQLLIIGTAVGLLITGAPGVLRRTPARRRDTRLAARLGPCWPVGALAACRDEIRGHMHHRGSQASS